MLKSNTHSQSTGTCIFICAHNHTNTHRDTRLGRDGADTVKRHRFFKNDSWTFDNIRQHVPPVVPELKGDMDTQYFDVIEDEKEKPESFATPRVRKQRCVVN